MITKEEFIQLLWIIEPKREIFSEILETKEFDKYIQEKLIFYRKGGEHIPAYLLMPKKNTKSTPTIYCHHQHASNWKIWKSEVIGEAWDPDMAYARELAELWFITFAPDAIAFEERQNVLWDASGNYFELAQRIVRWETLLGKTLEDIRAWIDYLVSRKEVDENRIWFIGHSYGGRMALVAPIFDERIKSSVSHCWCVNYKDSIHRNIWIQIEFCVPDILSYWDIEDIIRIPNSCKFLISGTREDKYSYGIDKLQNILDKKQYEVKIYDGWHMFSKDMRQYSYDYLRKNL